MPLILRCLIALFALLPMGGPALAQDPPVIAAAADLRFALEEIAAAFTAETGTAVSLTFGSTGNFATQIREGAPFQMFMAADEKFVGDLHAEGLTVDVGTLYGEGRMVLVVPKGAALKADEAMADLTAKLAAGQITRFAIANPEHAPYGARAAEALRHAGLWDQIQPHLVLGENVSQAAQFALSGEADGGIIAYALVLAPALRNTADYALIPADWHAPLRQRMVLLPNAGPVAQGFYVYMQTPAARAIMSGYGFALPDEIKG